MGLLSDDVNLKARRRVSLLGDGGTAPDTGVAEHDGNFAERALKRGTRNTRGGLNAFKMGLGDLLNLEQVEADGRQRLEANMKLAALNPARYDELSDIESLWDVMPFVTEKLAENVPMLMAAAGTGGAAAVGTRVAVSRIGGAFAKRLVADRAGKELVEAAVKRVATAAGKPAAKAGATGMLYALSVGEVLREFEDAGVDATGTAFVYGVPIAGLDALALGSVLKTLTGVKAPQAMGLLEQVVRGMGKGAMVEAPTETLQEALIITARAVEDPTFSVWDDLGNIREDIRERLAFAGVSGAAVGGGLGGIGGGVRNIIGEPPPEPLRGRREPSQGEFDFGDTGGGPGTPPPSAPPGPAPEYDAGPEPQPGEQGEQLGLFDPQQREMDLGEPGGTRRQEPPAAPPSEPEAPAPGAANEQLGLFPEGEQPSGQPTPDPAKGDLGIPRDDTSPRTGSPAGGIGAILQNADSVGTAQERGDRRAAGASHAASLVQQLAKPFGLTVQFDPAMHETGNPDHEAFYRPGADRIALSPRVLAALGSKNAVTRQVATEIIAHEVGHAAAIKGLGLEFTQSQTISSNREMAKLQRAVLKDYQSDLDSSAAPREDTRDARVFRRSAPPLLGTMARDLRDAGRAGDQVSADRLKRQATLEEWVANQAAKVALRELGGRTGEDPLLHMAPETRSFIRQIATQMLRAYRAFSDWFKETYGAEAVPPSVEKFMAGMASAGQSTANETGGPRELTLGGETVTVNTRPEEIDEVDSTEAADDEGGAYRDDEGEVIEPVRRVYYNNRREAMFDPEEEFGKPNFLGIAERSVAERWAKLLDDRHGAESPRDFEVEPAENYGGEKGRFVVVETANRADRPFVARDMMAAVLDSSQNDAKVQSGQPTKVNKRTGEKSWGRRKEQGVTVISANYGRKNFSAKAVTRLGRAVTDDPNEKRVSDKESDDVSLAVLAGRRFIAGLGELARVGFEIPEVAKGQPLVPLGTVIFSQGRSKITFQQYLEAERAGKDTDPSADPRMDREEESVGVDTDQFEMDQRAARDAAEAGQARKFTKETQRKSKDPGPKPEPKAEERVEVFGTLSDAVVEFARAMLDMTKLAHNIKIVTNPKLLVVAGQEAGLSAETLRGMGREFKDGRVHSLLWPPARIYIPKNNQSPAVIWLHPNLSNKAKIRGIAHELGHLIQTEILDSLDHASLRYLKARIGGRDAHEFSENFANELIKWVNDKQRKPGFLGGLMHRMGKALQGLWVRARRAGVNESFSDFMDGVLGARGATRGVQRNLNLPMRSKFAEHIRQQVTLLDSRDLPPFRRRFREDIQADAAWEDVAEPYKVEAKKLGRKARRVARSLFRSYGYQAESIDSYLRGLDSPAATWIANQFYHPPGYIPTEARAEGLPNEQTIEEEVRHLQGLARHKLQALITRQREAMGMDPKTNPALALIRRIKGNKDISDMYREVLNALVRQTPAADIKDAAVRKEVEAVREYLEYMHGVLTGTLGMNVGRIDNYFPLLIDVGAIEERKLHQTLIRHGLTPAQAEELATKLAASSDPVDASRFSSPDDPLAPGFDRLYERKLLTDPKLIAEFHENGWLIDDIWGTLAAYTASGIRRGVWQKRFGGIPEPESGKAPKLTEQGEFRVDPMLKIKRMLAEDESLSDKERKLIAGKIIDTYAGRLSMHRLSPRTRRWFERIMVYQNIRILGFAQLASLPDAGGIAVRAGDLGAMMEIPRLLMDKGKRKQMRELAELIGQINDDFTDHILNDQLSGGSYDAANQSWNNAFFWAIGLKAQTDFMRIAATSTALDFMREHAEGARAKDPDSIAHLRELGVQPKQIAAWVEDAKTRSYADMVADPAHKDVVTALNRWVDGAIMRPSAAQKPMWMSDHRFQLVTHLKSYMFSIYQTILKRVYHQMQTSVSKGNYSGAVVPLFILTASMLPLAMLGWEVRRFLDGGPMPDMDDPKYWQQLVERAGLLGPAQMGMDMNTASQWGQFALLGVAGPTVDQFYDLLTQKNETVLKGAVPLRPYVKTLDHWFGD